MWKLVPGTLLVFFIGSNAAPSSSPETREIEARAVEVVRDMCTVLTETKSFAVKADEIYDELLDVGLKIQFSNRRTVAVQRPNQAVADVEGDAGHFSLWYNKDTVSAFDKRHNAYTVFRVPDELDETLDFMASEYDTVMPLADLVRTDCHDVLTGNALFGMYVGIHEVDGVRSHHVAFANDWLEWQLWIDAENDPLPRKIVINYKNEPGEPQYTAVLRAWNLSPDLPEGLFEFEPPDGATRMEAKNFRLPWARGAEEEK